MTDKDLLKRRIDTYNNLISRLDRITSANYMHIVAGMRCTLKAMIDNNLAIIDSTQENPCEGCTNRKGCVTCENGELKETELSHSEVTKISDQDMPLSEDLEEEITSFFKSSDWKQLGVILGTSKLLSFARHFAQWHKHQMMKNAIPYRINNMPGQPPIVLDHYRLYEQGIRGGDKVKLIIVKED